MAGDSGHILIGNIERAIKCDIFPTHRSYYKHVTEQESKTDLLAGNFIRFAPVTRPGNNEGTVERGGRGRGDDICGVWLIFIVITLRTFLLRLFTVCWWPVQVRGVGGRGWWRCAETHKGTQLRCYPSSPESPTDPSTSHSHKHPAAS